VIAKDRLVARIKQLPTLPGAVLGLHRLLQDKSSTAKAFEDLVRPDPALTTNLLRLANSAHFRRDRDVDSVRQAFVVLGARRFCDAVTSVALSSVIPTHLPGYGIPARDFWLHCIAVGILTEKLAHDLKRPVPDSVFAAALLHDLGKLAISTFLMETTDEVLQAMSCQHLSMANAEHAVLGLNHAELGAMLAQTWGLPALVVQSARWHHDPDGLDHESTRDVVDLIHVADLLSHMLGLGADVGELGRSLSAGTHRRLGMAARQIETVACATEEIHEFGMPRAAIEAEAVEEVVGLPLMAPRILAVNRVRAANDGRASVAPVG